MILNITIDPSLPPGVARAWFANGMWNISAREAHIDLLHQGLDSLLRQGCKDIDRVAFNDVDINAVVRQDTTRGALFDFNRIFLSASGTRLSVQVSFNASSPRFLPNPVARRYLGIKWPSAYIPAASIISPRP